MSDEGESGKAESGTLTSIHWKKEIVLVVVSAILGGVIFSAVSPFIVPTIHDIQVNQFEVQNPTVGIEVEYAEGIDEPRFSVPANESYDRYTVTVQNPSQKQVSTVTVGLMFPGVIEAQQIGFVQPADDISYSRNAWLVAGDPPKNFSYTSNALKVDELPPLKEVSATFLIDRSPEETPKPGYWDTAGVSRYEYSRGTIMVSGQYRWQFKGSVYTEMQEFVLLNESQSDTYERYDVCVGKNVEPLCRSGKT